MKEPNEKQVASRICLVLGLATLFFFCQVVCCDFIYYDDPSYVIENPDVNSGLSLQSVTWAFSTLHGNTSYWHPLTWLSHMLDCQIFGLTPAGHHFTSLVIHVINSLLLFVVLRNATSRLWPSAFVAGLFALHPLHVESVAWVSERKDVLSTMFCLLAMMVYVEYARRPGVGRYLLVLCLFILGLMSKPMVIVLPFVLLLLDYWPLQRLDRTQRTDALTHCYRDRRTVRRLLLEKVPFIAIAGTVAVVTLVAQKDVGAMQAVGVYPIPVRIANALISYTAYIYKMFLPLRLAVFYPHPGAAVSMTKAVAAATLLIAITIGAVRTAKSRPYCLVGWLWFMGTLLPVIGLIQVGLQGMADRYTYIPLIGLFIIISWGGYDLVCSRLGHERLAGALAATVLIVLGTATAMHLRNWRNSSSLFAHAARVTENNYLAIFALGQTSLRNGDYAAADRFLVQSLELKTDFALGRQVYADSQLQQGNLEIAREQYLELLRNHPDHVVGHLKLAEICELQNRVDDAVDHLTHIMRHSEAAPPLVTKRLVSLLCEHSETPPENVHHTIEVLEYICREVQPDNASALDALAVCYYAAGRIPEALAKGEEALGKAVSGHYHPLVTSIREHRMMYRDSERQGLHRPARHERSDIRAVR